MKHRRIISVFVTRMMMNRTNYALQSLIEFKGIYTTNFFLVPSKNPFSYFTQLGLRFNHHNTRSASFHSNYSSNSDLPRSVFENVTNLDDALKLFDDMSLRRPLPSVFKFNQLMNAVTKLKHFSSSLDLFKQMCSLGVPVNIYSMNIAIKCCCLMHRINDGFALLGCCFRRAIVPDVVTFGTILDGLILENRILEAEMLFKKLIKKNICEPDVVMYNTMIKGLCKFGNNITAIALLKLMDERGCKPNRVTYNTVIDSLCKDTMIDDAFKLLKEMVIHKGVLPDIITYNSLISGLCKLGRWEKVYEMLKEMEDASISPNVLTYNILVDAFCKEGKLEEAEAVINIMVVKGIEADIITYCSPMDGYCLRGEMSKARRVFDLVKSRGLVPDVVTYNALLNGYCKNSNVEEALHMFREMIGNGMKPDVITYNTMIQGLFRVGHCGDALELFNEMRAQGHIPNEFTYAVVVEGLCNNNQVEEALSLFHLGDSKLNSYIVVYNILIDGACKCGRLDIAKDLFRDLTNKGLQNNVRTYNVMINWFVSRRFIWRSKTFVSYNGNEWFSTG